MIKHKHIFKKAVTVLLIVLGVMTIALLIAFATGRSNRCYSVLPENASILINGKQKNISEIAADYIPKTLLRPSTPTPPLKWIWYEAIQREKILALNYYFTWENEIHPNKIVNVLYAVFRAAYYGYPLYDIEYFQVNINTETEQVEKLKFETSESDNFYQATPKHINVEYKWDSPSNTFEKITGNEKVKSNPQAKLLFDGNRVYAGIQTWNHLTKLLDSSTISAYKIRVDAPLRYLTGKEYSSFKFSRKSAGDFSCK